MVLRAFILLIFFTLNFFWLLIDAGIGDPKTSLGEPLAQPRQSVERVENPGTSPQDVRELLVSFRSLPFFKHTAKKSQKVSQVCTVFLVALLTALLSSITIHSTFYFLFFT